MTSDEFKVVVPAAAALGGVVAGGVLNPSVQSIRERYQARRNTKAALHESRRDALTQIAGALYKYILTIAMHIAHVKLVHEMENSLQQASLTLAETLVNFPDDRHIELASKTAVDSITEIRADRRSAVEKALSQFVEAAGVGNEAVTLAVGYGQYEGVFGMEGRSLSTDLYEMFAVRQEGDEKYQAWRSLVVLVARDVSRLADWENRAACAVRSFRRRPRPITLETLPKLSALMHTILNSGKGT